MNKTEQLMQAVRDEERGTYAKGKAWVAYMKHARVPGTEDRRVFASMMRRHRKWPLGMRVATKTPQGYLEGRILKHDRGYLHECLIDFSPNMVDFDGHGLRVCGLVPFRNIKKLNVEKKMRRTSIERFRDLGLVHNVRTGRTSAALPTKPAQPQKVKASALFGGDTPIDHEAHVNCSCHPKA